MIETLLETAKTMARVKWVEMSDRTHVIHIAHKPEKPTTHDGAIGQSFSTEIRRFLTPGGIEFGMGYNVEHDELLITTF